MPDRTRSIDALRGSAMVLMALDHARDFFVGLGAAATQLETTTLPLFFTRWLTHFCAPIFVLLAGTSAYLHAQKYGLASTREFLVKRGLFLVLLELTIVRFAWIPEPFYRFTLIQVIWVLGWSMLVLAALSFLPLRVVVAIGAALVLGHNSLDPLDRQDFGAAEPLWDFLHERAQLAFGGRKLFVSYPLLPWPGVAALGFGLGRLFEAPARERRRWLMRLGAAATLAFVLLRASNLYGDPRPWSSQPRGAAFTLLSFLNCEKYPPSLAFLLMTLGPATLVLAAFELSSGTATAKPETPHPRRWLELFGRVPLFFYVAHLYLLRFTAAPLAFARFGKAGFMPPPGHAGSPNFPLWAGYVAWALALLLLYPACRWFARHKAARRSAWLSYL